MELNNTDIVKKIEAAKIEPADINAIKTNQGLYEFVDGDLNLLEEGYEFTSIDVFTSALLGLISNDFSGIVYIKINSSDKKLYIHKGQIVFASSTMIDDRLGEVIYRKGLITLDQMTEAAVKVTRKLKFGRVMIESNIFNSIDLWEGLKSQVLCILQSIFLEKQILYKMSRDYIEPPTAILFEEPTDSLVKKYASVGYAYQVFRENLNKDDYIRMLNISDLGSSDNTYFSDINQVVQNNNQLENYLASRRLNESYSILDVFDLCHMGVATIDQKTKSQLSYKSHGRNSVVKGLIDAYQLISKEVYEYFNSENKPFPLLELKKLSSNTVF